MELGALMVVAWALFAAIPLGAGGLGLGWDALNHHVYLGWIADRSRFDLDYLAASYQSFQYPFLYWPFYKLFQSGIDGRWAGVALVSINVLVLPALWLLARVCSPENSWYGATMRWLGVALALLTGVVLSLFDSTANDMLAAIPFVWGLALGVEPWDPQRPAWMTPSGCITLSGLCIGTAVAFKLSNGPLAVVMVLLWGLHGPSLTQRLANVARGCVGTLAGVALFYGYWGWQLWVHYGDPVYPFYDHWFAPLRMWVGWQP